MFNSSSKHKEKLSKNKLKTIKYSVNKIFKDNYNRF